MTLRMRKTRQDSVIPEHYSNGWSGAAILLVLAVFCFETHNDWIVVKTKRALHDIPQRMSDYHLRSLQLRQLRHAAVLPEHYSKGWSGAAILPLFAVLWNEPHNEWSAVKTQQATHGIPISLSDYHLRLLQVRQTRHASVLPELYSEGGSGAAISPVLPLHDRSPTMNDPLSKRNDRHMTRR